MYFEGRYFPSTKAYKAHLQAQADAAHKKAQADAQARALFEQRNTIRARNATTHGLFARDVVLPHLGEDSAGYEALMDEFNTQIGPRNLLERHYTEKIAAASWRLRRLQRWQAQVYEDPALTEDERLDKLDKVLRHESALHRQIDTAVRMLSREVPRLFEGRSREVALSLVQATERDCARSEDVDWEVSRTARERRTFGPLPAGFDPGALDNTRPVPDDTQNCQNEPPTEQQLEEEREAAADEAFYEGPFLPPDHVHPDGRPAFICPSDWREMRELRAEGKDAEADERGQECLRHYQSFLAEEEWKKQRAA